MKNSSRTVFATCLLVAFAASCPGAEPGGDGIAKNVAADGGADADPAAVVRARTGGVQECGDGTLVDLATGLHWEMKHASDGGPDFTNPHDVDNQYSWTSLADEIAEDPDGTLFVDFLKKLNERGEATGRCFAGHCDWRLPKVAELISIRQEHCTRPQCVDAEYGPNKGSRYWSGDTVEGRPNLAWAVKFFAGRANRTQKKFALYARAVRAGTCP